MHGVLHTKTTHTIQLYTHEIATIRTPTTKQAKENCARSKIDHSCQDVTVSFKTILVKWQLEFAELLVLNCNIFGMEFYTNFQIC